MTFASLIECPFEDIVAPPILPVPWCVDKHLIEPADEGVLCEIPLVGRSGDDAPLFKIPQQEMLFLLRIEDISTLNAIEQPQSLAEDRIRSGSESRSHNGPFA